MGSSQTATLKTALSNHQMLDFVGQEMKEQHQQPPPTTTRKAHSIEAHNKTIEEPESP
jgi:hypothetical protein